MQRRRQPLAASGATPTLNPKRPSARRANRIAFVCSRPPVEPSFDLREGTKSRTSAAAFDRQPRPCPAAVVAMDPRFQQHVPPTGPAWPSPHDPAYGGPGADTRRLSPLSQQGAPMPSPSDSRPGYPSLAPGGHPLHGTSPASASPSAYPHLQGLPNMPPPISEPEHLAAGMAHMGLQSSPNREVSVRLSDP